MTISAQARSKGPPVSEMCPACAAKAKPRSPEQHRRFFALMKATFMHWPETHERQFASKDEMRKWLQMKAGWREVGAQIPIAGIPKDKALFLAKAAIQAAESFAEPVFYKDNLVIFKPKSIAFAKMGPAEFNALNDAVSQVIEMEIGIPADRLLKETESAA